jgi:predicted DNA binding CopG/RHH family protein
MAGSSRKPEKLTLPPGLSPAEEAQWWDDHEEYWDSVDTPWEVVPPQKVRRTGPVTLRLPLDLIESLKQEAEKQGVAYQTVIRMWLDERVASERKRAKRKKTKPRIAEDRPA